MTQRKDNASLLPSQPHENTPSPRMLRRVAGTIAHTHELAPGYRITYWTQTLECGHVVKAFEAQQSTAKRRACAECNSILQNALTPKKRPASVGPRVEDEMERARR